MAKKEVNTDLWVHGLLNEAGINLTAQGCDILEIDEALKTASKSGTGNVGYPEFCGKVKDFLIVIEDKAALDKHICRDTKNLISQEVKAIKDYAVNGALFYGLHLAQRTSLHKVFAFGVSGNEKRHRITPIFINERGDYMELQDVETFISFNETNIDEYYSKEVLKEETDVEKTTAEILKDAEKLHKDLRSYGQLTTEQKPLIVSGIMLALREIERNTFSINSLIGDSVITDGQKIYEAIRNNLLRANVTPDTKRDKLLSQFAFIKDTPKINEKEETLGKTPLKHFTEFLYNSIYKNIRYQSSAEDYLGRFYGEFMSYSGGDGQTLGIVLTPKHITELFCELAQLKPTDKVFDPCCGTAGFLIAAMHHMIKEVDDEAQRNSIKRDQLFGIELQPYMFTIATTNMILRGDGKSNLHNLDFLKLNPAQIQLKGCTVGMMNPPYSQGSKNDPTLYEISFTEHLLDSLTEGARAIVIIPQSSVTGKSKEEQNIKNNILKHHTLEGVITLNKETFYRVGTNPCIAVFTAGIPHSKTHRCKFINFEDDGFEVSKHVGLIETANAKDKRQHLLDVWFGRIETDTKFCVETTIEPDDEWLHAFYYFNDEIPTEEDFEKTMADYLTFEFNMLTHGRGYLFESPKEQQILQSSLKTLENQVQDSSFNKGNLSDANWKSFYFTEVFTEIQRGKRLKKADHKEGWTPYVSSTSQDNGVDAFVGNDSSVRRFSNCLTLANSGSVGCTFYHKYEFVASDHVTQLKHEGLDKYAYLFMVPIINRLSEKYSFNREINDERIKREMLLLPITDSGEIDFAFMSSYMMQVERTVLSRAVDVYRARVQSN